MRNQCVAFVAGCVLTGLSFGQTRPAAAPMPVGPASVLQSSPNELFNGWRLSPAGRHVGVNAMPMKMAFSPDGRTLAAVCAGRVDGLALVDVATGQATQWLPMRRAFNGVGFSPDGRHVYVTGGNSDAIAVFDFDGKTATEGTTLHVAGGTGGGGSADDDRPRRQGRGTTRPADADDHGRMADHDRPADHFLAGLAVDPKTGHLYVCDEATASVLVVDPAAGRVLAAWRTQADPYACCIGAGGLYLYVSNWGDRSVTAIDMATGRQAARIGVGLRPGTRWPSGRTAGCSSAARGTTRST